MVKTKIIVATDVFDLSRSQNEAKVAALFAVVHRHRRYRGVVLVCHGEILWHKNAGHHLLYRSGINHQVRVPGLD
jgi:hypothetical protein